MNEVNRLYRQYQSKVKKLRKSCSHKKISKWMPEWSEGFRFPTGYIFRYCLRCNKVWRKKDMDKLVEMLAAHLHMTKKRVKWTFGWDR